MSRVFKIHLRFKYVVVDVSSVVEGRRERVILSLSI